MLAKQYYLIFDQFYSEYKQNKLMYFQECYLLKYLHCNWINRYNIPLKYILYFIYRCIYVWSTCIVLCPSTTAYLFYVIHIYSDSYPSILLDQISCHCIPQRSPLINMWNTKSVLVFEVNGATPFCINWGSGPLFFWSSVNCFFVLFYLNYGLFCIQIASHTVKNKWGRLTGSLILRSLSCFRFRCISIWVIKPRFHRFTMYLGHIFSPDNIPSSTSG